MKILCAIQDYIKTLEGEIYELNYENDMYNLEDDMMWQHGIFSKKRKKEFFKALLDVIILIQPSSYLEQLMSVICKLKQIERELQSSVILDPKLRECVGEKSQCQTMSSVPAVSGRCEGTKRKLHVSGHIKLVEAKLKTLQRAYAKALRYLQCQRNWRQARGGVFTCRARKLLDDAGITRVAFLDSAWYSEQTLRRVGELNLQRAWARAIWASKPSQEWAAEHRELGNLPVARLPKAGRNRKGGVDGQIRQLHKFFEMYPGLRCFIGRRLISCVGIVEAKWLPPFDGADTYTPELVKREMSSVLKPAEEFCADYYGAKGVRPM